MVIVTGALILYSTGVITEQMKKILTPLSMTCLTGGILLDITATACMIAGSRNLPFTVHGIFRLFGPAGYVGGYDSYLAVLEEPKTT